MLPRKAIVVQLPQQLLSVTVAKSQHSTESCSAMNTPSLQGIASRLEMKHSAVKQFEL